MNSDSSRLEWFLMFPLWVLYSATGGPHVAGPAMLVAFFTLVGLWVAIFSRWKRDDRPPKLVGIFLVAVVGFFPVGFLITVRDSVPLGPRVSQLVAVVQFYFSLSVLSYGEAYWQHRGRAAYVTAGLTTLIAFLVWMFTGLYYVLMLE